VHSASHTNDIGTLEPLAQAIFLPRFRDQALDDVAKAITYAGNPDRGEELTRSISTLGGRAQALQGVAHAARYIDAEEIAKLAESHPEVVDIRALMTVIRTAVASGDHATARTFIAHAEQTISRMRFPDARVAAVTDLVTTATRIPDWTDATDLINAAAECTEPDRNPPGYVHTHRRDRLLARLAIAAASTENHDLAQRLFDQAIDALDHTTGELWHRMDPGPDLVEAAVALGSTIRAEQLVQSTKDPRDQAKALVGMARASDPVHAPHVVARIVRLGDWRTALEVPLWRQPEVVNAILGELSLVRDHDV
jgi:hypothetical protein